MTNLGDIQKVGNTYGLRTWLNSFKQVKDELGWADYRLTSYEEIDNGGKSFVVCLPDGFSSLVF